VQAVRSELTVTELSQARGYMETIFNLTGPKVPLVAASLHAALGEQITKMETRANTVQAWAATAVCPLPLAFQTGQEYLAEIRNATTQATRLPAFLNRADALLQYRELLDRLEDFQREQAAEYQSLRDYYNGMRAANPDIAQVSRFVEDWRALAQERAFTDTARWHEIRQTAQAAQQALAEDITIWWEDARQSLKDIEAGLSDRLRNAGVPEEAIPSQLPRLRKLIDPIRPRLEAAHPSLGEVRGVQLALTNLELKLGAEVQPPPTVPPPPPPGTKKMRWAEVAGDARIQSKEDIEAVVQKVRKALEKALDESGAFVVD
jgi:hypothetical protein